MLQTTLCNDAIKFGSFYSSVDKFEQPMRTILNAIKYRHMETGGVLLLAPSGCGKTRLAKKILNDYFEPSMPERDNRFGIYVEAPGSSLNELYRQILVELGDIKPEYGTAVDKLQRIIKLINELDVKVIFLDEIQVVLPSSGLLPNSRFVREFKEMANKTNCAWVLMGVPDASSIVTVDSQLADRLPNVICLEAFSCSGQKNVLDFMEYLFDLLPNTSRKAPFFKCLNESITKDGFGYKDEVNYDNLLRLCLASQGKPRHITRLLLECIENTNSNGSITKVTFVEAYNSCYQNDCDRDFINPFMASMNVVKERLIDRGLYA